jgi:hypothetical protein
VAEVVAVDGGQEFFVFALLEVENMQYIARRVVFVGALGASFLRLLEKEKLALARGQIPVDAGGDRGGSNPLFDTGEVDLDRFGSFLFLLVLLFV